MFERTTCACRECVACCKRQPGPVAPGDLEMIAAYLGETLSGVLSKFWASPGAVVKDTRTNQVRRIGTITPKLAGGRCVFLGKDDRCSIHSVAPFGCAYADMHMPEREWQRRAQVFYVEIERDTEYQKLRSTLDVATHWNPVVGGGDGG